MIEFMNMKATVCNCRYLYLIVLSRFKSLAGMSISYQIFDFEKVCEILKVNSLEHLAKT